MDAARRPLGHLQPLKQVDQLLALLAINSRAQLGLIVDGDLRGPVEHTPSLAREVQPAHAPVVGIGAPLEEPGILEMVHECHHAAGRHAQPIGERLLRLAIRRRHEAHQEEVARVDAEPLQGRVEAPRGEEAELRDQKSHAARRAVGLGLLHAELLLLHNTKITLETYSCYKLFRRGTILHRSPGGSTLSSLTRWVLAHKRTVVLAWIFLTIAGIAAAGPATDALDPEFSVPNKEGWETNVDIAKHYRGTGGDT